MRFPRESYIPAGAQKVASKRSSAVVYLSQSRYSKKPAAVGFFGKADKPSFNYSFATEARRAQYVSEWLQKMDSWQVGKNEVMAKRKAVLGSKQELLKVGDVLSCSWGYDQTNVDYFQVVELFGKRGVVIRKIACESIDTGFMQGKCVPAMGQFIGEPMRKQVSESGSVRIYSFASAYKLDAVMVDGKAIGYKPSQWTAYA